MAGRSGTLPGLCYNTAFVEVVHSGSTAELGGRCTAGTCLPQPARGGPGGRARRSPATASTAGKQGVAGRIRVCASIPGPNRSHNCRPGSGTKRGTAAY